MDRSTIVPIGLVLGIFFCPLLGQGADPPEIAKKADEIAKELEKAKDAYKSEILDIRKAGMKWFADQDDAERKKAKPDPAVIARIKEQITLFDQETVLPGSAPEPLRRRLKTEHDKLKTAYDTAITGYIKLKKDDVVADLQKEWADRQAQGIVIEANLLPHRQAAQLLHPFCTLGLQQSAGKTLLNEKAFKKNDPLPNGAFVIVSIGIDEQPPAKFFEEKLLPSLKEIGTVKALWVSGALGWTITEDEIIALSEIPSAKSLSYLDIRFELTPKAIDALNKMPNLADLPSTSARTADDVTLGKLKDLPPRLRWLTLAGLGESGNVTRKGLENIAAVKNLYSLVCFGSPSAGELIRVLPKMSGLQSVNLEGCPIGDDDLKELAQCKQLTSVLLGGTKITNDGLVHLGKLPRLEHLAVHGTKVSDDGLPTLGKIKTLRNLNLAKTAVTKEAVEKLARDLPRTRITFDGGEIDPNAKK